MARLKKITVDVASNRVIESVSSTRLARKPIFYAGETASVDVILAESSGIPGQPLTEVRPNKNQSSLRLGSTTTLVANSSAFTLDPDNRVRAAVSVTTGPCVTLPIEVTMATIGTAPVDLQVTSFIPPKYTQITVATRIAPQFNVQLATQDFFRPAVTVAVPLEEPDAFRYPGMEIFVAGTCVTFNAALNTTSAASFSVVTANDTVVQVRILSGGSGYPPGAHAITFTGGACSVAAEAIAVASGGSIVSAVVSVSGEGYVTAPVASLFTPEKSVQSITPSIVLSTVNSRPRFYWHTPAAGITSVTLSLSAPTGTGTPVTAISPVVLMNYVTVEDGMPVWEISVPCAGYGYVTNPAVSVPDHEVSARRRITTANVSGNQLTVSVAFDNTVKCTAEEGSLIPAADPYHTALAGKFAARGVSFDPNRVSGEYEFGAAGFQLRSGTYSLQDSANTPFGSGKVFAPGFSGVLGRESSGEAYGPSSRNNLAVLAWDYGTFTLQNYSQVQGRSFICAVMPPYSEQAATGSVWKETAPDRYAVVRVTFPAWPGGSPQYFVAQALPNESGGIGLLGMMASQDASRANASTGFFAPGGGFWEPTLEFLDYGKGYKTTSFMGNQAHLRHSYNLRVLSGLSTSYVFDESSVPRAATAVTTGVLGSSSFLPTRYSREATVSTYATANGFATAVLDGGYGYQQQGYFSLAAVTVPNSSIQGISLKNRPVGYRDGTYPLTISGDGSGAAASMIVFTTNYSLNTFNPQQNFSVSMVCRGSGYTSVTSVTAPAPNIDGRVQVNQVDRSTGRINSLGNNPGIIVSGNQASLPGYINYRWNGFQQYIYPLQFEPSPEPGGTAQGTMRVIMNKKADGFSFEAAFNISKEGYGYLKPPAVSVAAPDLQGAYIKNVKFAASMGKPLPASEGIIGGAYYPVPTSGLPPSGNIETAGGVVIPNYHACVVTPSPSYENARPDIGVVVTVLDFSAQRANPAHVAAVCAGNAARINAEKIWDKYEGQKVVQLRFANSGVFPASTPVTVSTPTFPGNAITSITVTCAGYFYADATRIFASSNDATGTGLRIFVTEVENGGIKSISLRNGGEGFSDTPEVLISEPGFNPADLPSQYGIKRDLVISVASANSVLGNMSSTDALLEVYETEGAEQQVIAQIPVTLAKRVSPV